MGTNFSVNSLGPAAAAPVERAPSAAVAESVPAQLPPGRSVVALERSEVARMNPHGAQAAGRQIVLDRDAGMMVYQVIDRRSGAVVWQVPEEAVLRRRAYFHALDIMRDAHAEPPQTDRTV